MLDVKGCQAVDGRQKVAEKEKPKEVPAPGAGEGIRRGCDVMDPGPMLRQVPGRRAPTTSFTGSRRNATMCPITGEPRIS